jgi:hypothetical protein
MQPLATFSSWIGRRAVVLSAMLLVVGLASLVGCAQQSTGFIPGKYTKTITEADLRTPDELNWIGGEWTKEFREDGTYFERYKGEEMVRGTYTISGNQITTVDAGGPLAGTGDAATATFHWAIDKDGSLMFSDYPSKERLVLTVEEGRPWTKAP